MDRLARVAAILSLLVGLLVAAGWCDEPSPSAGPFQAMGLSPEQTARLRDIHGQFTSQKRSLHAQIDRLRRDLSAKMASDSPDSTAIKQSLRDIVQLEERHQELLVDEYVQVLAVLNPEQKRIFRERMIHRILHDRKDRKDRAP